MSATESMSDFDLAASACGHDTTTTVGAAEARGDYRVWDLLDLPRHVRHQVLDDLIDDTLLEAMASLRGHSPLPTSFFIAEARAALHKDET